MLPPLENRFCSPHPQKKASYKSATPKNSFLQRIKKIDACFTAKISKLCKCFRAVFQGIALEFQSVRYRYFKFSFQKDPTLGTSIPPLSFEENPESPQPLPVFEPSKTREDEPQGPVSSSRNELPLRLPATLPNLTCLPGLTPRTVLTQPGPVLNRKIIEIKNWIESYREVNINDQDIVAILCSENYNSREISEAFSLVNTSPRGQPKPNPTTANPSAALRSTINESIVLAADGINQYRVGASKACTLICSKYLEQPSYKSTPKIISEVIESCRNSSIQFIDTEECIESHTQLELAVNPWNAERYDGSYQPMTVDSRHEYHNLSNAFFYLVGNTSIKGALIIGENIALAFKKIDEGQYEIFDPHGDYVMTKGRGLGAYVYRCRTINQVIDFFGRKLPIKDVNTSQYLQVWPVSV